jgi:predicted Zn finger-like uncharacterized protein
MIIQCGKCDTRFRFDESLIEGDGVWVRCSRCQHVFFQEREEGKPASGDPEIPSVRISDARRTSDDRFFAADASPRRAEGRMVRTPPAGEEKEIHPEIEKEISLNGLDVGIGAEEPGAPEIVEEEDRDAGGEAAADTGAPRKKGGWGWTILKLFLLLLLIAVVSGGVSLWLFPEVRFQALEWAAPWLRDVPAVEKLLGTGMKGQDAARIPVRIKDVRERSVANLLSGNIRVIEGVAVNQSPYPLAKIRVRLAVSDAYDVLLAEKYAYAGNLLTDAELGTLAESEIQRELSTPEGTDIPNDKVPPNGEIPFMLIFTQDQAGVVKTIVTAAGAERVP